MARKKTASVEPKGTIAVNEGKISKATKGNKLADAISGQKASVMYLGKVSGIKGNRKINATANENQIVVVANGTATTNGNDAALNVKQNQNVANGIQGSSDAVGNNTKVAAKSNETTATANGEKVTATANGRQVEVEANGKKMKCVHGNGYVAGCNPGDESDCPLRSGQNDDGMLSCQEVYALLKSMGVKYPGKTSRCIRAAIMRGYITITGHKADMNKVVFECEGGMVCNHGYKATLKQLLYQPDDGGMWYEEIEEAPLKLRCQRGKKCEEADLNKAFVTGFCMGQPQLDSGKFHNHCEGCPAFGICLGDYRESHFNAYGQHVDSETDEECQYCEDECECGDDDECHIVSTPLHECCGGEECEEGCHCDDYE